MPLIETTKILPEYGESDLDRIMTARIDWQKLLPQRQVEIHCSQPMRHAGMNQGNDRIITTRPTIETFEFLLKLLTRDRYEDRDYHKDAKKLQTFSKNVVDEFDMHYKIRDILDLTVKEI